MPSDKIFLSYTRSDEDWARQLAESLKNLGVDVWFDEWSIRAGDNIPDAIEQGLREADAVVLLISPESIQRPNLFFELGAAIGSGKRVVALVPSDLDPADVPAPVRARKYLVKRSPQETARELVGYGTGKAPHAGAND